MGSTSFLFIATTSSVTIEALEMMERRHHLYLSMGIFLLLSNGINGQENMDNAPEIEVINQLTNTVNELKAQFQDFQTSVENQLVQKDQMIDQLIVTVNEIKAQLQCQEGKKSDFCNVCADGYEKTEPGECVKARNPNILVVGGGPGVDMKTELWPGSSKNQCNLPDFPMAVSGAVGFNIAQGPVICGGYVTTSRPTMITTTTTGAAATTASTSLMENRCFILKHRHWMPFFDMTTTRWRASATEINNDQTLIIGGRDENWNYLKTTELISSSGTEKGKDFPVTIQDQCNPCYGDWWTSRRVFIFSKYLVCGLDHTNIHARTNHENEQKLPWMFHCPSWNPKIRSRIWRISP